VKGLSLPIALFCLFVISAECRPEAEWKEKKSEHFIVYYKEFHRDFLGRLIRQAEHFYRKITDDLGYTRYDYWTWDNRAKIYIYNDKEDYLKGTRQPEWSVGAADSRNKEIIAYYGASAEFFNTVLPHEMGHLMLREFIGLEASVPLWFEEGVATMQEKGRRHLARRQVRQALSNKTFIPLDSLSDIDIRGEKEEPKVRLFYNEALMVIIFLIDRFGRDKFVNLCRSIRDGKNFEEALSDTYYGRTLEQLNKEFIKYMRSK